MSGRVILATVAGSRANERLVVAIVQGEQGRTTIELCEQHHGEGIGWFDQRSVTLDPRAWQQLQAVLGATPEAAMIEAEARRVPEIIPFGTPPESPLRRSAVGGRG